MKDYLLRNKEAYDALAKEYEKNATKYSESDKKLFTNFIEQLKKQFGHVRILELGPGSGLNLSFFEKEGFETTAIDISDKMIGVAKKLASNTKYIHDEFLEHDFGESNYEGIIAKAFVHLFPKEDAIKVLEKIKTLLAPDGIAFISTTLCAISDEGFSEKSDYTDKKIRFRRKWTETELLSTIESSGFEVIYRLNDAETDKNKNWIVLLVRCNNHSLSSS